MGVQGEDLAVAVAQKVAPDAARAEPLPFCRRLVFDGIEIGRAAQDVVVFEFVDRKVSGAALQRRIAAGGEKTGHLQQAWDVFLLIPAIELGFVSGINVGPHHQQTGSARPCHRPLLACGFERKFRARPGRRPSARSGPEKAPPSGGAPRGRQPGAPSPAHQRRGLAACCRGNSPDYRLPPAVNPTSAVAHPTAIRVPCAVPAPIVVRTSDPIRAMPRSPADIPCRIGRSHAGEHCGRRPGNHQSGNLAHVFSLWYPRHHGPLRRAHACAGTPEDIAGDDGNKGSSSCLAIP